MRLTRVSIVTLLFSATFLVSAAPASAEPLEAEGEVWSCAGTPVTGQNLCSVYCFNNITGQVELRNVPTPPPDEGDIAIQHPTLRALFLHLAWTSLCNATASFTKVSLSIYGE